MVGWRDVPKPPAISISTIADYVYDDKSILSVLPQSEKAKGCNSLDALAYSLDFASAAGTGTQLLSGAGALGAAATGAEPAAAFLGGVAAGSSLFSAGASGASGVVKAINGDFSG